MYRLALYLVAAICIVAVEPSVQAQSVRTRIPVITRLVKVYSDYERRLAEAINHRDAAGIDQLVAKDFELWPANHIGVPTPRADWIAQSFKEPLALISIGEMAVHDYGNVRIVSFVMNRTVAGRKEPNVAIIDVWNQSGRNSVLKVRYAAIQTANSQLVPGEVRPQQIEKRY